MQHPSIESDPGLWGRARHFVTRDLWDAAPHPVRIVRWARSVLQICVSAVHGSMDDQILLRASSLTYYTVLSLIPLLAIALAIVGALGIRENVAEALVGLVAAGSPDAKAQILDIVGKVKFGSLGTLGAAMLFATTILGISSIEHSLNTLWNVDRARSWERRFPDYLAVVVIAPLVLGVAVSLGATLKSDQVVGYLLQFPFFEQIYHMGLQQTPIIFLSIGLAFLYWFLPNTQVRATSALIGGVLAAILFSIAQSIYVGFQFGVARANVLFGAVFFLPVLFVWIYTSWVIVLLGGEVAYAHQSLGRAQRSWRGGDPTPATREAIGMAVALAAARDFASRGEGLTLGDLEKRLDVSYRALRSVVTPLLASGVLSSRGEESHDVIQLGRAAEAITLADVLSAVRGERAPLQSEDGTGERAGALLEETERAFGTALGSRTLADAV